MKLNPRRIFLMIGCLFTSSLVLGASTAIIPEVNLHPKQSQKIKQDAQVQTTHFERKDIKTSPVNNLSELLKQQQSIIRVTNVMNGNESALSIRGFGDNAASNSLILVDGFPLTNFSMQAPNFNAIALSDIERIDIIEGSQGSLWGDQAVGGVVNIVTRHPENFIGDAAIGYGNFDQHFYNVLVGSKFDNGFFFKSFGFTHQTNNYRDHNNQKDKTIFLQTGSDYARGTVRLSFQSSNNSILFPGSLNQTQFDENQRQAVNFKNRGHDKINNLQLLSKHAINADWILETRLAHQQIESDGVISTAFNTREWENTFNPRLIGTLLQSKLTLGYAGQNSQYQFDNALFHERVNAQQNNIYAQMIYPLSEQFDMTLGARFASQNNAVQRIRGIELDSINHVFVTELGLSYHPSDVWQFYLRRDGNFRFPKANEETWLTPGATTLQPQTGVSYEAGMVRHTERQKTQLNLYHLQLNHEIGFDPTQTLTDPFGTFQNFSATSRNGITLTEYYKLTPVFTLNTQLNYVKAYFNAGRFSGNTIPAVPAFNANAGFSYDFMEHWRGTYSALYTSSRYASLDFENTGKKQAGYWLNTFAIQYIQKSFNISFEVDNMFNQKYATYTLFDSPTEAYRYYPGIGRSFLLTIKTSIDE